MPRTFSKFVEVKIYDVADSIPSKFLNSLVAFNGFCRARREATDKDSFLAA
jgi:hypothetical protein